VDKHTRLISVALVSHQNGYVHDLIDTAHLAHAHGGYLYADAIQALGTIPVDVQASGVDFLCAGAYKWMLARPGIAPFFVRRDLFQRLRLDRYGEGQIAERLPNHLYEIYTDARRFEAAPAPPGPTAELAASLKYIEHIGLACIESHTVGMGMRLQLDLDRQGHRMFTPPGNRSPIVAFYIDRPVPEVRDIFRTNKLNVTARNGTVRVSPALFNTADEIDNFLSVAKTLL
jgi:selenocysteine lyase/cysteine desulfurase